MANRISLVKQYFVIRGFEELYNLYIFNFPCLLKAYDEFKENVEYILKDKINNIIKNVKYKNTFDEEIEIFKHYFKNMNIKFNSMEAIDEFLKYMPMNYQYDILYSKHKKVFIVLIFREDF